MLRVGGLWVALYSQMSLLQLPQELAVSVSANGVVVLTGVVVGVSRGEKISANIVKHQASSGKLNRYRK